MSRRIKLLALASFLCAVSVLSALPRLDDSARASAAAGENSTAGGRSNAGGAGSSQQPASAVAPDECDKVPPLPLPSSYLPARMPQFQEQLSRFLQCRQETTLNW